MKTNGNHRSDRLETLEEWKEYAEDLENILLLRPLPIENTDKELEVWKMEYVKWWSDVVDLW